MSLRWVPVIVTLGAGLGLAVGVAELLGQPARAAAPGRAVVVELFTSQGCSSCPPADRLLSRLGERGARRAVPLAFHVDYWNHLGWSDPFSSAEWTRRQESYARLPGARGLYTPQAIVDGEAVLVGSDETALQAAIAAAASRPALGIELDTQLEGAALRVAARVSVPGELRGRRLDLLAALYESGLETPVRRGENGGRKLRNDRVVRTMRRLGALSAADSVGRFETRLTLAPGWRRSGLGVAVFAQDPRTLSIHGAADRAVDGASSPRP